MPEVSYSFNELVLIEAEACECALCPEALRPAAPPDYSKFIISLLILLLLSMLYNLRLYLSAEKHKKHIGPLKKSGKKNN